MIRLDLLAGLVVLVVFSAGLMVGAVGDSLGLWAGVVALVAVGLPALVLVALAKRAAGM